MKKTVKFTVPDEAFQDAIHIPAYNIPYFESTEEVTSILKFDFIIIRNKYGNELIRNYMNAKNKVLQYTSCFDGDKHDDISLTVLMTLLDHSVTWIRHGTHITKKLFPYRNFPLERLKREISFIDSILSLCQGEITMEDFLNILEKYKDSTADFSFYTAFDILDNYPWEFALTDLRLKSIHTIKNSLNDIVQIIEVKSKWKEISQIGYRIHNEPYYIHQDSNEF